MPEKHWIDPVGAAMLAHHMRLSRRRLLYASLTGALASWWRPQSVWSAVLRGGTLFVGMVAEPTMLTSGVSTDGMAQLISPKIFDGLFAYDDDLNPVAQLATSSHWSKDQLALTLTLRSGVRWHDGHPFTSADVAFSALQLWKQYHSRGRTTFANLLAVDTPDDSTAIFRLSSPAPYLMSALGSAESQILPKHLYAGTDPLSNPHNNAPVGTGPYRYAAWKRGEHVELARNPDYWDQPRPYLEQIIFQVVHDSAAMAVALETEEIHIALGAQPVDLVRLSKLGILAVDPPAIRSYIYAGLAFNLDRPLFRDVRIRRAIAHAVDQSFILNNIYLGYGAVGTGPIPPGLKPFYSGDVPRYPFDPAKAAVLLDQAGLKPDGNGVRLSAVFCPQIGNDATRRQADYIKQALGKVGIRLDMQTTDFAAYIRRIYSERNFDICTYTGSAGPDPAIGTQRIFWSKNYKPGVAFSNVAHYASPEADRYLEAAQVETDAGKRVELYKDFQRVVQTDLPLIPLPAPDVNVVRSRRLTDYRTTADGAYGNFADAQLARKSSAG
jgi:peptide/nickel transport system substrate-binding protein